MAMVELTKHAKSQPMAEYLIDEYFRQYPPQGYGTRATIQDLEDDRGYAVHFTRFSSCD